MANLIVRPAAWNQIPADQREIYQRQWQMLTQAIDEHKAWQAKKAAATPGSPEFKKASKKVSDYPRWISDILQAPPETFADIDLSRGKVGPDVHDAARRIMKKSTSTGGTMHHITAIMQTQGAWKGLNMAGVYEMNERLKELGIVLGTQDPNLVEVPNTKHQLHMDKHATTDAGKTDWANKPWRVEDTKDWASIEARVEAIRKSDEASRAAHNASEATDWAKAYRERLAEPARIFYGEEVGQQFKAGLADPGVRNPVVSQAGIELGTELNKQGLITSEGVTNKAALKAVHEQVTSGDTSEAGAKRLLKILNKNKPLLGGAAVASTLSLLPRAVKAAPFVGTGYEAATHDATQKAHDLKIAQNPDDLGQKAQKYADWWGGKTAQASLTGMGMTAAGAKMMFNENLWGAGLATTAAGLGITAVSETANLGAGLTSLAISGARGVGDMWNRSSQKAEQIKQEQSTAKQLSVGFAEGM